MVVGQAPGKILLFGEHSVVYGQPAIAAPVFGVKASVQLEHSNKFEIKFKNKVNYKKAWHAIEYTVDNTLRQLGLPVSQDNKNFRLTVDSQVPVSSGMGSGAAVGVATIRAVTKHFDRELTNDEISRIDFKTEQVLHAHPSGIDNTVVSHEQPIVYQKGKMTPLKVGKPIPILIANTGVRSSTKKALVTVRKAWENNKQEYDGYFENAGRIARQAEQAVKQGDLEKVGQLMTEFQDFFKNIKMSHPSNERLVKAALENNALGAKISGAGLGGCVIALTPGKTRQSVRKAWEKLGPEVIIKTEIK
jgi:mevalonate kinase